MFLSTLWAAEKCTGMMNPHTKTYPTK